MNISNISLLDAKEKVKRWKLLTQEVLPRMLNQPTYSQKAFSDCMKEAKALDEEISQWKEALK